MNLKINQLVPFTAKNERAHFGVQYVTLAYILIMWNVQMLVTK